ncbi:MAG: transposase [Pseudomonadota bacterium]|jgi:hypothetical protein
MPRGRPTAYRPEYAEIARKAYANGATAEEVADLLEIDISTFYRWRSKHEAFAGACVTGKHLADEHVVNSLHQRACGYDYIAERLFMPAHAPGPIVGRYTRRVLADPRAALQWLRIRRPDEWRIPVEDQDKDELADIILQAFARVAEKRGDDDKQG